MKHDKLWWLLTVIAVLTIVSGLVQLFDPSFVLGTMSAEATATSKHFFGIVGMFMALFGGMTLHALLSAVENRIVFTWAGAQKLGASIAVGLGVMNGIFSSVALLVAGFDLATAVVIAVYLISRRTPDVNPIGR
jgi:hypothetical protein